MQAVFTFYQLNQIQPLINLPSILPDVSDAFSGDQLKIPGHLLRQTAGREWSQKQSKFLQKWDGWDHIFPISNLRLEGVRASLPDWRMNRYLMRLVKCYRLYGGLLFFLIDIYPSLFGDPLRAVFAWFGIDSNWGKYVDRLNFRTCCLNVWINYVPKSHINFL